MTPCPTCGWFPGAVDSAAPPAGWCVEHAPGAAPAPQYSQIAVHANGSKVGLNPQTNTWEPITQ